MRILSPLAVTASFITLALHAAPAEAAPFSGKIEMKMTTGSTQSATATTSIGEDGALSEIQVASAPAMKMKSLIRFDKPDTVYMINDAGKTYTETTMSAAAGADETWTVKKRGTEKILGYAATHVQATSSKGTSMEMWMTKDLMDSVTLARALSRSAQVPGNLLGALEKESAAGFMLRMVSTSKDGNTTRMEVTKIEKVALPKTLFAVPAGYTKATAPSIPGMPPDAQKKLDEAMKNMTPEQRAAMQKAMGGAK